MMLLSTAQWVEKQRIAVTGGAGTLGRHLIRRLIDLGAKDIAVLDLPEVISPSESALHPTVKYIAGSVLEESDLQRVLRDRTVVFHLAGAKQIGRSLTAPVKAIRVNTLGSVLVAEICRRLGIEHLVFASTGEVYGINVDTSITEDHPTNPESIYGSSKLASEAILKGYASSFGLSSTIIRFGEIYGGSSRSRNFIDRALLGVAQGQPVSIKNPERVRHPVHIDDAAEAAVRLATLPPVPFGCRVINVSEGSSESEAKIAQLVVRIGEETGFGRVETLSADILPRARQSMPFLDIRVLQTITAWMPSVRLEDGIRQSLQREMSQSVVAV